VKRSVRKRRKSAPDALPLRAGRPLDHRWRRRRIGRGAGESLLLANLVSRIMKGHIIYMSLRAIQKGEELTVDYNYDETDETMRCLCGTQGCRGVINRKE